MSIRSNVFSPCSGSIAPPVGRNWRWKKELTSVVHQARVLAFALKHPDVPWLAKAAAGCAAAYILSPIQLIPTFLPVIGQMDDLAALYLAMKALRKFTPPLVLAECEMRARKMAPATAVHHSVHLAIPVK
jgi:uncharacterized membrane protein YkvA (DUF1232 family)